MRQLILVFITFQLLAYSTTAQQSLMFGTATMNGKTTQCRFEVSKDQVINSIVLAPYGVSPTRLGDLKDGGDVLTFTWTVHQSAYRCRLAKYALGYEGDCLCDGKPSIRLVMREFTPQDAWLQGDSLRASAIEVQILDRAIELLDGGKNWNRVDNRVCDTQKDKWSLFCALYQASVELDGDYRHLRPAVQASRQAINEFTSGKKYAHLLQDYNNEAPNFDSILKTLERAKKIIYEKIASHQ